MVMTLRLYRLPGVQFRRRWVVGPVSFLPAAEVRAHLQAGFDSKPAHPSGQAMQERTLQTLTEWGEDSCAAIEGREEDGGTLGPPQPLYDALALLRFAIRQQLRINVEHHRFGLPGDFPHGIREYVTLLEGSVPIAATGWSRTGGTVPLTLDESTIGALESDPAVQLVARQLDGSGTTMGRKAVLALRTWDAGLRSLDDALRALTAVQAVEIMLSDSSNASQSLAIARRAAYLTCPGQCGRDQPLCLYTERRKSAKQLLADITERALRGEEWECSSFLSFASPKDLSSALRCRPMYDVRNDIVHAGSFELTEREASQLRSHAESILRGALAWFNANPGLGVEDLDEEIDRRGETTTPQ